MAERRMFAKTIIDSDAFLEMPISSQLLYFHLSIRADDDGFINNPKKIQRMVNCSDDDVKILIAKKFIIPFESGIVVIKHWKIHNYIRNDRYNETKYKVEKSTLSLDENNAYSREIIGCLPVGIPSDIPLVDTGKVRLGKDSIDKDNIDSFFETIWLLYPKKEGKASVKPAQRERLYKLGYDKIKLCIDRHLKDTVNPIYYRAGNNFFNTYYIDYLDENYKPNNNQKNDDRQKFIERAMELRDEHTTN